MGPCFRTHFLGIMLCLLEIPEIRGFGYHPCNTLSSRFLISPIDILVKQNEDVVFTCALEAFDNRTHSLTWDVYQNRNGRVTYRYEDNRVVVSTFTFIAEKREDYYVSCRVRVSDGEKECQETKSAWAIVQCFPTKNEITCARQAPTLRHEEGVVILECSVVSCNPPVDMVWTFGRHPYVPGAETRTEGKMRVLTQEIHSTHNILHENITCMVTSKVVFRNEQLNCTIEPITKTVPSIQYKKEELQLHNEGTTTKEDRSTNNRTDTPFSKTSQFNETGTYEFDMTFSNEHFTTVSNYTTKSSVQGRNRTSTTAADVIIVRPSNTRGPASTIISVNKSLNSFKRKDKNNITIFVIVACTVVVLFLISCTGTLLFLLLNRLLPKNESKGMDRVQHPDNQAESRPSEMENYAYYDDCLYEIPTISTGDSEIQSNLSSANMVNENSDEIKSHADYSDSSLSSFIDSSSVASSSGSNQSEIYFKNAESPSVCCM